MRWCIVENSRHSRLLFLSRRIKELKKTADCVYGIMSDLADKEDREGDRENRRDKKRKMNKANKAKTGRRGKYRER